MICSVDGTSAEPGDLCEDPDERCRAGECVSRPTNYGIACEQTDECEDELLVCLDDVCVTTSPGESGDPCWDDLECDDTTVCYELGDGCQVGNAGEPCTEAAHCQFDLVCTSDDDPGVCTAGALDSPCTSDEHCQFPLLCGPEANRFCQRGKEGDPCDDDGNCSDIAPYCGPSNTCQDGEEGDGCSTADDCAGSLLCSTGGFCQDGGDGDECTSAADCAGSTPFCGPAGCQEGTEGQPCSDEVLHCQDALFCSTLGECRDGTESDPCGDDTDCAGATPICGPFGCHDGTEGDGCFTSFDCADEAPICSADNICQDGDEGDACSFDGDCVCDCGDGVCEPGEPFGQSREIELYEPCADMSPAFRDEACESGNPAFEDGSSSWHRTDEPVEIPLANGYVDSSVVGYWPLDGDTHDVVADGLRGTNNGASTSVGRFGDSGGALLFDTGDYLDLPGTGLMTGDGWTTMVWVETSEQLRTCTGTRYGLVTKNLNGENDGDFAMYFSPDEDCAIIAFITHDGGTHYIQSDVVASSWSDGSWHHLALTWEGTSLSMYVDGHLQSESYHPVSPVILEENATSMLVGNYGPDGEYWLYGTLDDLVFFSRLLTPAEITAYYNSRQPYGTSMVSDAQEDFDDVRVTEQCGCCDEERITHEIIGVHPHSDTDLDHVVAYWRLDGDPTDETGSFDGTNHGAAAAAIGRFGDVNGGFAFSGAEHIDTGFVPVFDVSDSFSIELWARVSGENNWVFGFEHNGTGEYGQISLSISDPAGLGVRAVVRDDENHVGDPQFNERDLRDGQWHHYALVRDVEAGLVRLYIDGLLADAATDITTTTINAAGLSPFIGARNKEDGTADVFTIGDIDEVIIHDVARSADYIYNRANPGVPMVRFLASTDETANGDGHYDYNTYRLYWDNPDAEIIPPLVPDPDGGEPCQGLLSPCNGYVGWWRFDESTGVQIIDSSTRRIELMPGGGELAPDRVPSLTGLALQFDGADDQVSGDLGHIWANEESISLEALTRRLSVGQHRPIVTQTTSDGCPAVQFGFSGDGPTVDPNRLEYYYCDESVVQGQRYGSDVEYLETTEWYHVGFSLIFGQSDSALLVTNGAIEDGGWRDGDGAIGPIADAPNFMIGNRFGLDDQVFHGLIDNVRIMNRALETDEFLHYPLSGWSLAEEDTVIECVSPPVALGEACDDHIDCESANCSNGYCSLAGFAYIPAGTFCMGSPGSGGSTACPDGTPELGRVDYMGEGPLHEVTITRSFVLAETELTQEQWQAVMGSNPSYFSDAGGGAACGDDCPVENVSWWDVLYYLNQLSAAEDLEECYTLTTCSGTPGGGCGAGDSCTGDYSCLEVTFEGLDCTGYRLPTEAEWEYAIRAGTTTAYYNGTNSHGGDSCGNDPNLDLIAWYCDNSGEVTHPVRLLDGNGLGLYDMSGNVWEWVWDWYDASYYSESPTTNPLGASADSYRVLRSGYWGHSPRASRSAHRNDGDPASRYSRIGARVARSVSR